jgi:Rieske Fe-S protein
MKVPGDTFIRHRRVAISRRRWGPLLLLGAALLGVVGVMAFLGQRPAEITPPPSAVAKVTEVTSTPLAVSVVMHRGADRLLQRQRYAQWQCTQVSMGCPATTELRSTPVFLVNDEAGALHAFIGEDPRNGCALDWLPATGTQTPTGTINGHPAVFHDICHGSLYNRRGEVAGGPSPFNLNELATEVRDGDVYVDPGRIIVGACPGCPK